MTKKMLIDAAHPEEVRVAVLDHGKVEDFDFESESRKPLRGNIYLARVTRVEPSLQAAFVEYGGNRHGFLAFSEIHPDYYQIPVSDRRALQQSELEVAELAELLELSQRGDDDHDDDDDEEGGHSHANGSSSARPERNDNNRDDQDGQDEDAPKKAVTAEADSDDEADDEQSAESQSDDPADEIAEPDADEGEEEDEEEEDGEEEAAAPKKRRRRSPARTKKTKTTKAAPEADDADAVAEASDENPSDVSDDVSAEAETAGDDENVATASDESADDVRSSDDTDDQDDDGETTEANDASSDENEDDSDELTEEDEAREKERQAARSGPNRQALFEKYKEAKRKRSNLLRNYKIQEVIKRRQILLVQVVKEERGGKGAALTTYMSLAGRYCVLMPNTARGGGISRKIPHSTDRRRLRRVVDSLDVPQGMGLIIRTAGAKRTKIEVKRDYDYLLRLWENIRTLTLKSIAPCLIYEEASLIKRAIRDLYDKDIGDIEVEGDAGYREAKDFMKMLMPSHAKFVQPYKGSAPIFLKHGVEAQLDGMYQPTVRLKSGGYIVIHQTEALIAIDVNSGRATRERNIEQTALKTNIEAAYEAARQFRLRDLAGLIVLDFIDMEEPKNNRRVEKALKDAIKHDRARIQIGRISNFGLMEMSRQRRRSGIIDGTTQACPTCLGAGVIRSAELAALRILRAIEGEAITGKAGVISAHASLDVTVYVLNHHRDWLKRIEESHGVTIQLIPDTDKSGDVFTLEKSGVPRERTETAQVIRADQTEMIEAAPEPDADTDDDSDSEERTEASDENRDGERKKRRRRRRRKDGPRDENRERSSESEVSASDDEGDGDGEGEEKPAQQARDGETSEEDQARRRRRRGRRGGRRNRRGREGGEAGEGSSENAASDGASAEAQTETGDHSPASNDATPSDAAPAESHAEPAPTPKSNGTSDHHDEPVVTKQPAPNGNGAHHDDAPDTTKTTAPVKEKAEEDLAEAPQPVIEKPKKKGWWRRGSDA